MEEKQIQDFRKTSHQKDNIKQGYKNKIDIQKLTKQQINKKKHSDYRKAMKFPDNCFFIYSFQCALRDSAYRE